MDLALLTGDQSDNQQYNETLWVRQLIEGGAPLTPNSGIKSDYSECRPTNRAELLARETAGADPRRADLHGRPGLRRPRLPGARLLRPGRALRRPVRHLPDLAGPDGPRPVAHLRPGRAAPRRHAGARPTSRTATTTASCRATRTPSTAFEDIATGCFKLAQQHVRAAGRPESRPEPALLAGRRLRGPPGRAGPALRRQGRAQADLLRPASRRTTTASASSTRPSSRPPASPPPTGRAT